MKTERSIWYSVIGGIVLFILLFLASTIVHTLTAPQDIKFIIIANTTTTGGFSGGYHQDRYYVSSYEILSNGIVTSNKYYTDNDFFVWQSHGKLLIQQDYVIESY